MVAAVRNLTPAERFWPHVDKTETCWLWTGYIKPNGYASFYPGGGRHVSKVYAHRFAYELSHGPIPDGAEVDHLCNVRHCVNPRHLEAVTKAVNIERRNVANGWNLPRPPKVKAPPATHCPKGHAFSEANTYVHAKSGKRACKTCSHARYVARRAA